MEFIFEFIFELIFEGCIEGAKNKKVPMPIRIFLSLLIGLLFLFVIGILLLLSFILFKENEIIASIIFVFITLILIYSCYNKVKCYINTRKQGEKYEK